MSREVIVEVKVRLAIELEGDCGVSNVINNMDYHFISCNQGDSTIKDSEIVEFEEIKTGA